MFLRFRTLVYPGNQHDSDSGGGGGGGVGAGGGGGDGAVGREGPVQTECIWAHLRKHEATTSFSLNRRRRGVLREGGRQNAPGVEHSFYAKAA